MNTIELAKEAGFTDHEAFAGYECTTSELLNFAALVRAKREWVDLTDDEIAILIHRIPNKFEFGRAVIAAFKGKNK